MKVTRTYITERMKFIRLLLISVFGLLLLRFGYMQIFYQQNVVSFAFVDQKANEENAKIIKEVKTKFNVNLDQFEEVDPEVLIYSGKSDVATVSLLDMLQKACQDGCIGQPAIYTRDEKGYVFLKNKQQENVLLKIAKFNDRWSEISADKTR